MSALGGEPPHLNPFHYGWAKDMTSGTISAIGLPADIATAPDSVLKLIRCGCSSSKPCATVKCICCVAKFPCSMFCGYHNGTKCYNPRTKDTDVHNNEETNQFRLS